MNRPFFSALLLCALMAVATAPSALARNGVHFISLKRDQPQSVAGIDVLCTGVGADTQNDADLREYTMRVQFVGKTAQYLANARVSVSDMKGAPLLAVRCPGAWLLLKLTPGRYHLVATLQKHTKRVTAYALNPGANIILRFPEISGNE